MADATAIPANSAKTTVNAYYSQGARLAQQKEYARAEPYLREAIRQNANDSMAHYQLANVLVQLKRRDEAVAEYTTCYQLDPFGPVSGYCRQALLTFRRAAGKQNAGMIPMPVPVSNQPNSSDKSDVIQKQIESAKDARKNFSDGRVKNILDTAEREAQKVEAQAQEDADNALRDQPVLISPYTQWVRQNPLISEESRRAEADRILQQGKEKAEFIRARAKQQAQEYMDRLSAQSSKLDEAASNLDTQLNAKQVRGSAYLKKEGTNLFVRNYGADPGPIPEVHNSAARITSNAPPTANEYEAASNLKRLRKPPVVP
ncbi:MAG TPA: tetratricopeptide repeat protein, partial [Chroococcales cyanobacterium]